MRKHIKPAERRPTAGAQIPIITAKVVVVRDDRQAANMPKHGKLNYLGGPNKKKPARSDSTSGTKRLERKSLSVGQYIGNGSQLTAFVMLDPEDLPKEKAANE